MVVAIALTIAKSVWPVHVYATSVGEQRTISLADGSLIALNTQSRVRVDYSDEARDIYLIDGQALFTVSHDSNRPFRVHVSGGPVVQAIGTKFDVRRLRNRTTVAVLEGRVQVTPSTNNVDTSTPDPLVHRAKLGAGEAINVQDTGAMTTLAAVDLVEVNAWQQRRLIFKDRALSEIVEEFNRYNRQPIRIADDDLATRRYSGVWDADHPDVLFRYLLSDGDVTIDRNDERIVIRRTQHLQAPP